MHDATPDEEFVTELTANQPALQAFIAAMMPGHSSTDDVLQKTNLTLWRKREDYQSGTNFRAWAFECAKWTMRAHLKEEKRRSWLLVDDELTLAITARMAERMPHRPNAAQSALRHCLDRLRPADRDLVISHYEDGVPLGVYAKTRGRSTGGLKVTLFRLRAILRRCVIDRLSMEHHALPSAAKPHPQSP
jgi:RNA polymerase sigma-70 factor (ECF subfamily)